MLFSLLNANSILFLLNSVVCQAPPRISFAHISPLSVIPLHPPHGLKINYECDTGLEVASGQSTFSITCQDDGHWSEPTSICKIDIHCEEPPSIMHSLAHFEKHGDGMYRVGETARFSCSDGFLLAGNSQIVCLENGEWSLPPVCKAICPNPPEIENGRLEIMYSDAQASEGDSVMVICEPGYDIRGPSLVFCVSPGQWTDVPTCGSHGCGGPPEVENSEVLASFPGTHSQVNDTVKYRCIRGYQMMGDTDTLHCNENGSWLPYLPECVPSCGHPIEVENAVIKVTYQKRASVVGDSVNYECLLGYKLHGTAVSLCQTDHEWSPAPRCFRDLVVETAPKQHKDCGEPPSVANSVVRPLYFEAVSHPGDAVVYQCLNGYILMGSPKVRCLDNYKWTTPPICQMTCGVAPDVDNSVQTTSFFGRPTSVVGDSIYYVCQPGYILVGPAVSTCLGTGKWSTKPNCMPQPMTRKTCDPLPFIANGVALPQFTGKSVLGNQATVTCSPGYLLPSDEEATITCTEDGWTEPLPRCKMSCGPAPSVPHASIMPHFSSMGDQFALEGDYGEVICVDGFDLKGPSTVQCTSTGLWSPAPFCIAVSKATCGNPPLVVNATIVKVQHFSSKSQPGDYIEFECNEGLDSVGSLTVWCQDDGSWSDLPLCIQSQNFPITRSAVAGMLPSARHSNRIKNNDEIPNHEGKYNDELNLLILKQIKHVRTSRYGCHY